MLDADSVMKQAGLTAQHWMECATRYVEGRFGNYPPEARATLIAAYMKAAAGDEIAMHVRALAETVSELRD